MVLHWITHIFQASKTKLNSELPLGQDADLSLIYLMIQLEDDLLGESENEKLLAEKENLLV